MVSKERDLAALASKRVFEEAGRRSTRDVCGQLVVSMWAVDEAIELTIVSAGSWRGNWAHVEDCDVLAFCHDARDLDCSRRKGSD